MAGVHNSLPLTHSDAIADVVSKKSCHIVLEKFPPDYVEKISRYLEGQNRQDEVSNELPEADSDSGDSLFITQKPVPEAVRSGRRRLSNLQSDCTSHSSPDESEDDTLSPASHGESKPKKGRRKKNYTLPKYDFPFATKRRRKPRSTVPVKQNNSLHNLAMGGFFKCVRELWQGYRRGDNVLLSLPTVDVDGESISPLSEEEEERSENEDIKVVERKCFVVPSKAKSRQTWGKPSEKQKNRKAAQRTSQGQQWKTPAKASISSITPVALDTESSDDGESSCRVQAKNKRNNEHISSDRNSAAQTEAPKTEGRLFPASKRTLFQQEPREEELCDDSDATVCEPHELQTSPQPCTQKAREESTTVTEPQTDVFYTDSLSQTAQPEDEPESQSLLYSLPDFRSDSNNDSVCNETREKKEKDKENHESVEEGEGQTQEEPEGAASVNVEVEESLSEGNRAEPLTSQTSDELEFNENSDMKSSSHDDNILREEGRDAPDSKPKKKKRKRNRSNSAAENIRQEVDGHLESDMRMEESAFSSTCNVENSGKKKKKKRKRNGEDDVEQLQPHAAAETPNGDAGKKKKRKSKDERIVILEECGEEEGNCVENTAEPSESSYVSRKKHKKKHLQDGAEDVDTSFSNEAVTSAEITGMFPKKKKKTVSEGEENKNEKFENVDNTPKTQEGLKDHNAGLVTKKKKKRKKKTISEEAGNSYDHEENEMVENLDITQKTTEGLKDQNDEVMIKKKKKKKKKMSEICGRNMSEDSVAQSDDSVSVREKEKTRTSSFLVADAEASQPVEKNGGYETAELTGNVEESDEGVRKKKKKRKRKMSVVQDGVEKDCVQDFEEAGTTSQSALPETTDTGLKRKHVGSESELVTLMERVKSADDVRYCSADEAVVMKRKKKKKCKDRPCNVSPPAAAEDTELERSTLDTRSPVSHKKKHDSLSSETPGSQTLNDIRDKKKKKKVKSTDNVSVMSAEPREKKKKERNKQSSVLDIISSSPMLSDTSLSISENKRIKVKRKLHNPSEDFFTDS